MLTMKLKSVVLGDFNLDVDVMITVTIATDSWDSLSGKPDPLIGLGASRDLQKKKQKKKHFIRLDTVPIHRNYKSTQNTCIK